MLYYYIKDSATDAVLGVDQNLYLITNIQSGILDSEINVDNNDNNYAKLLEHGNRNGDLKGININLTEFTIPNSVRLKQRLVKVRKPAFKQLLHGLELMRAKNIYGFTEFDVPAIEYALKNTAQLNEYAVVMNTAPEFAKNELTMIIDSIRIDTFRMFTIGQLWKKKINSCTTLEEINLITKYMQNSFWEKGRIVNV